ncbi:hypothetical protein HN011_000389 [Eciton burchellii]|nr:hypothetical protein HN011_000389 [Eciton burchellii]
MSVNSNVDNSSCVEPSSYRDQHFKGSRAEQDRLLRNSTTLYVGNLSFYTREEQIYELFSIIRTDWDAGFIEGRQYGRGKTGGQVRDEYRSDFDSGRGGYGKNATENNIPF